MSGEDFCRLCYGTNVKLLERRWQISAFFVAYPEGGRGRSRWIFSSRCQDNIKMHPEEIMCGWGLDNEIKLMLRLQKTRLFTSWHAPSELHLLVQLHLCSLLGTEVELQRDAMVDCCVGIAVVGRSVVRLGTELWLTLQRGVTGTARMLHALTHSSISRHVREQM